MCKAECRHACSSCCILEFLVTSVSICTVGLVLVFLVLRGRFAALALCETDEEFGLCCFRQPEQEELQEGR